MKAQPHHEDPKSYHAPMVPPSNTITLWVRAPNYEFWGYTIQSIAPLILDEIINSPFEVSFLLLM